MKYKITLLFCFFFVSFFSFPQTEQRMLKKANVFYENLGYFNAIAIYEKVANKGYTSVELLQKLGNAYYFNGLYQEAHKWYKLLFALNVNVDPIYYYRYSQSLKNIGDYTKAVFYLKEYDELVSNKVLSGPARDFNTLINESKNTPLASFTITNLECNSPASDFGGVFFKDDFLVTSTREFGTTKRAIDPWTSDAFAAIFKTKLATSAQANTISLFSEKLLSPYHVATPVFTKDGLTMYFTASSSFFDKKRNETTKSSAPVVLKIYRASYKNGKWKKIKPLPFNKEAYNTAHPVLSPDEKMLYFVSDNPAGFGGNDIYRVAIHGENSYGLPQNLGPTINTVGKETFPFVSSQDKLYFASDGHLGLGGLDVFVTDIKGGKLNNPVQNIGQPINSPYDDFYFVEKDAVTGFFSSNRLGGKGKDDIYKYENAKVLSKDYTIEGAVLDDASKQPIDSLKVNVYNVKHDLIHSFSLGHKDNYSIKVDGSTGNVFYLEFMSPKHETIEVVVTATNDITNTNLLYMSKKEQVLETGNDLSKLFLQPITFGLDKYSITAEAEVELQKVIELMYQFPLVKILIRTHTDSRHSFAYNVGLSRKRAKAVMEYIVKFGIAKNRLSFEGFGEYRLLNHCADGVQCTEDEHKINRRCEFIVQ